MAAAVQGGCAAVTAGRGYGGDYASLGAIPLIQCSIVRCARVGHRTSTCVRAGCVGHSARWPVVASYRPERSPERCIVAAFAAHQWTSAVLDGDRCI